MFVHEWMRDMVVTCMSNMRLGGALGLMNERKVRRLPIVDARKLVGIITKSDIYAAMGPLSIWDKSDAEEQIVESYMTPDPITVSPGETIENAALIMHDRRVSGLPVMDKKKLVGVITETDIFRAFIEIMGLREKGARIALKFKSGDKILQQIQKRTGKMGIRSLVTYRKPDKAEWTAIIRVAGRE